MGFESNLYDPCVANKTVNGSQIQIAVTWNVYDLKVSHKESTEVTKLMMALDGIYGNGLSVTRGKVHSYLGMDFDFSAMGDVKLSMIPYANQIDDDFPEPITCTALTSTADHLFQIRPDDKPK